ncbi:MAG: hypothetical protein V4670_12245 [Bacteroidota bacterium]
MITINQAPLADKILLDANNTLISITSTNGVGFYFRALIYVDDVLFDQQGWSRKDNFTSEKDLKSLYKAYFEAEFNPTFTAGLIEQTNLIKKISIVIQEIKIISRITVDSITFPDFYFMFNVSPCVFTDDTNVQFLGIPQLVSAVPNTGKISIPFMVNATSQSVVVTLQNNNGTTINTITETDVTGKKVYLYNFDLASVTIADAVLYLRLNIELDGTIITKTFRLFRYSYTNFPIKQLVYQNNFGYYLYAYTDGQLTIDNGLEIKSYEQFDYTDKVYEINEENTYTISTGSLVEKEKEIIKSMATSLDTKLFLNSVWYDLKPQTKKVQEFKDRNHGYSENLTFKAKPNAKITNQGITFTDSSAAINITNVVHTTGDAHEISFTTEFDITELYSEVSTDGTTWSTPELASGTTSPLTRDITLGDDFYVRLSFEKENAVMVYSNVYHYVYVAVITFGITELAVAVGGGGYKYADLNLNIPDILDIPNPAAVNSLKWKISYTLGAQAGTDARVYMQLVKTSLSAVLWFDYYETSGQAVGSHVTALNAMIPPTGNYTASPVNFQLHAKPGHTITIHFLLLDVADATISEVTYTLTN